MTDVSNAFWIERELAKVRDPNRRDFLRNMFAGEEGWQKFLTLMRTRTGADEFRNGEWQVRIPIFTEAELKQREQPCIYGCHNLVSPVVSEWGEVAENLPPVCPNCQAKHSNQFMENQNTQTGSAVSAEVTTSTKQPAVPPQPKRTLEEDLTQWANLTVVEKIRLGERIASESRDLLRKERTALEMKLRELDSQLGQVAPNEIRRGVGRPPKNRELAAV
jgi:hypothetical protein